MKKRVLKLSAIFLVLAVLLSASAIFAYFVFQTNNQIETFTLGTDSLGRTEISSEYDLRTVAYHTYFESVSDTSDVVDRKILIFRNDIVLTRNLVIENDINFLFNGHVIDLNGYDLTIRHTFHGGLLLDGKGTHGGQNGGIVNAKDTGKFYIETPNMLLDLQSFADPKNLLTIASFDFDRASEEIFTVIKNNLHAYYIDDIPLLFSYKSYPIVFEYSTDSPDFVNNKGNVTRPTDADKIVSIGLNLVFNGEIRSMTDPVQVQIIREGSNFLDVGQNAVDDYLSRFLYGTFEGGNLYNLVRNAYLLKGIHTLGLAFSYTLNGEAYNEDVLEMWGESGGTKTLTVTVTNTATGEFVEKSYQFISTDLSNIEIVNDIIQKLGTLRVDNVNTGIYLRNGEAVEKDENGAFPSPTKPDLYALPSIKSVLFSLDEHAKQFYEIDPITQFLTVKKLPSRFDLLYFDITVEFHAGTPRIITKTVKIQYSFIGGGGGGEGEDGYAYIYDQLIEILYLQIGSNAETVKSFFLPAEFDSITIGYTLTNDAAEYDYFLDTANNAVWQGKFVLNQSKIPVTNTNLRINITFDNAENVYARSLLVQINGVIQNPRDIEDRNLYQTILALCDIPEVDGLKDNILTVREVEGLMTLSLDGGQIGVISSYRGLNYCTNLNRLEFYRLTVNNLFDYLPVAVLTALTMRDSDFAGVSALCAMPRLINLDLSDNGLTQIANALPFFPKIESIDLSGNPLTTLDGLSKQTPLKYLTVEKSGALFSELFPLAKLTKIVIMGVNASTDADGTVAYQSAINSENVSAYVVLNRRGLSFYADEPQYPLSVPNEETVEGCLILEAIFYTKNGDTVVLPYDMNGTEIMWEFDSLGITVTKTDGIMTLSNVTGKLVLTAKVTVGGVTSQKVFVVNPEG